MKTIKENILEKYRTELYFNDKDLDVINKAFEVDIIDSDDVIQDFWAFRDRNIGIFDLSEREEDLMRDYDEYFDNGKTHTENFIDMLDFINS